jgi:DNA invertase Pin-like site-specific DNA recombinase
VTTLRFALATGWRPGVIYVRISANDVQKARRGRKDITVAELEAALAEKALMHAAECREYAADQHIQIIAEFIEKNRSASRYRGDNKPLPVRGDMLAWLAAHTDGATPIVVLSTEVERLYRDVEDATVLVNVAKRAPLIVMSTDGETYDLCTANGEQNFYGAVSKGAREAAKVSERRRRRERKRAAEGGYWGQEPFGYRKVYETDGDTGQRFYTGRLEIVPEQADRIADAARWLIDQAALHPGKSPSLRHVVTDWAERGVVTNVQGRPFSQTEIRRLLLNPRVNGKRVHRPGNHFGRAPRTGPGTVTDGLWEPILDDETFAAVRAILTDPVRRTNQKGDGRNLKHLLSGLAVCGLCGARMKAARGIVRKDGTRNVRYACIPDGVHGCGHAARSMAPVDDYVRAQVADWLRPDGPYDRYVEQLRSGGAGARARRTAIDHEMNILKARLKGIEQSLARGLDPEVAQGAIERIRADQDTLRAERDQLKAAAAAKTKRPPTAEQRQAWTVAQEREWLRQFVDHVVIRPAGQGRRLFDGSTVDVIPTAWARGLGRELAPKAPPPLVARPPRDHAARGRSKCTECGQPVHGRGLCSRHYQRWRSQTTLCTEDGCEHPVRAGGLCSKHYEQQKQAASPDEESSQ